MGYSRCHPLQDHQAEHLPLAKKYEGTVRWPVCPSQNPTSFLLPGACIDFRLMYAVSILHGILHWKFVPCPWENSTEKFCPPQKTPLPSSHSFGLAAAEFLQSRATQSPVSHPLHFRQILDCTRRPQGKWMYDPTLVRFVRLCFGRICSGMRRRRRGGRLRGIPF